MAAQELASSMPSVAHASARTMLLPAKIALAPGSVALSRHPYGCRVVQRILEHCDLPAYKDALLAEVPHSLIPVLCPVIRRKWPTPHSTAHPSSWCLHSVTLTREGHNFGRL